MFLLGRYFPVFVLSVLALAGLETTCNIISLNSYEISPRRIHGFVDSNAAGSDVAVTSVAASAAATCTAVKSNILYYEKTKIIILKSILLIISNDSMRPKRLLFN